MPVTSIMQLLHVFFSARENIVRIDSCTDDSIRISLTVAIRLIGAPVNRYAPICDWIYCLLVHLIAWQAICNFGWKLSWLAENVIGNRFEALTSVWRPFLFKLSSTFQWFLPGWCNHVVMYTSMAQCKTAVSPLLMHWRYCSLALNHRMDMCLGCSQFKFNDKLI